MVSWVPPGITQCGGTRAATGRGRAQSIVWQPNRAREEHVAGAGEHRGHVLAAAAVLHEAHREDGARRGSSSQPEVSAGTTSRPDGRALNVYVASGDPATPLVDPPEGKARARPRTR
jgi:hypothetical protein